MRKILLFIFPVGIAIVVFILYVIFFGRDSLGKGALQVTAVPQSNVYLNGRLLGKTPLCKCDSSATLPTGDYTIRLVPLDPALSQETFEQTISIAKSVLTVVDRTFGVGPASQGSVISLSPLADPKKSAIFVSTFPSGVQMLLDGQNVGTSPGTIHDPSESDHDLGLVKSGYKEKHVRIHTVNGYQLSVIGFLAIDPEAIASQSAAIPSVAAASTSASQAVQKVLILDTPTGFLRVRKDPTLAGEEIAQVKPGEVYTYVSEQTGWLQIQLKDGTNGWVSTSYAKKQ